MFHDKLKKTQEGNLILELHNAPWKDGWMFTVTRTSKGFKKRSFLSCVTICPSFSRPSVPRQQIRCTSRSCFADDFQQTTFPSTRLKCESHESDTVFFYWLWYITVLSDAGFVFMLAQQITMPHPHLLNCFNGASFTDQSDWQHILFLKVIHQRRVFVINV